jgi:hypothetical protein
MASLVTFGGTDVSACAVNGIGAARAYAGIRAARTICERISGVT